MVGLGASELLLLLFIFLLPFVLYQPICIGFISKKLGFNPWLMGLLSLIPVVNLVVLGVLAFSKERRG
jgi:hypothetical protein